MNRNARTVGILGIVGGVVTAAVLLSKAPTTKAHGANPKPTPDIIEVVKKPVPQRQGKVQIALLLDTSSSMSGLIEQAKSQLWKMVNELSAATRGGQKPIVEIALYEYGKSSLSPTDGYIRRISALTTDLDTVSEQLFALSTVGGDEYAGMVIRDAARDLEWSSDPNDVKVIFIAGNEPFTQGPVEPRDAISAAREKGIVVHTIHCGDEGSGIAGGWKDGAVLAGGEFMSIDHNRKVVHIKAPQDEEIARLGVLLNGTYLGYGSLGREAAARQSAQDSNAYAAAQGAEVQRALTKASVAYKNWAWDLVDADKEGRLDVAKLSEDELPDEMKKMTPDERHAFVDKKAKERAELSKKIAELNAEREKFVAAELKKRGEESPDTLDAAMVKAVQTQAEKTGWKFE